MIMKNILCFGDSNTYGLIPGTKNRYDWHTRWTGIVESKIKDKGYKIVEEGLCGRTTIFDDPLRKCRRGTEIFSVVLETHKPIDTVILMLGTNDCKAVYNATAEIIGKGIEILIDEIRRSDPNINVLLVSPIELGNGVWEKEYDPEFNSYSVEISKALPFVYKRVAERQNVKFLQASKYAVPSDADREHLDEAGHKSLAEAIYKELSELLNAGQW